MARLRIVLVEPREAGNVGAAARVMKNFGFDDLWIVGEHPELLPVAGWWASGSDDLLERARFAPTLQDAIADANLVVATTSARGREMSVDLTPPQLAIEVAKLADDQIVALVFGREDSGLTREEVTLCHRNAIIPTNERFPTMNLAQAIGVFCYELSSLERTSDSRELAPSALRERFHERFEALLLEVGFLHENNPARIYEEIRALFGRASLDEREATIWLGIVKQIEWRVAHPPGRPQAPGLRPRDHGDS